jgi:hypothetical protein
MQQPVALHCMALPAAVAMCFYGHAAAALPLLSRRTASAWHANPHSSPGLERWCVPRDLPTPGGVRVSNPYHLAKTSGTFILGKTFLLGT